MEIGHQETLLLGSCTFQPDRLTLRNASGLNLPLRSQSARVLAELAHARGKVVSRDDLIEMIWHGVAVTDDSLVQCIKDIRHALSDKDHQIVKTIVGQGYALNARTFSGKATLRPRIYVERIKFAVGSALAEDLAEALFEELVIRLAPRAGLALITEPDRRAEASFVISGRVSTTKNKARIFFQMTRSGTGEDIHADTAEALGEDILNLPVSVADKIASQLRILMFSGDGSELVSRNDAELSVQELMSKAAWHQCRFRRENWHAARASLEAAVKLAPQNPVALAMFAAWDTQMIPLIPFDELPRDANQAMELCQRAVEIDSSIDYVLRTRGNLRLWRFCDHAGARLDCERALDINPTFHLSHLTIATSEILSGEFSEGAQRLEEMMRRAPMDFQNPLYFSLIALAELLMGHEEKAIAAAREGYDLNPLGSWNALVYATTAARVPSITNSIEFRSMVQKIDLPSKHYLDLPFTAPAWANALVSLASEAGVNDVEA